MKTLEKLEDFLKIPYLPILKTFKTTINTAIDLNKLTNEASYLTQVTLPLTYFPFGIKVGTSMYNFIVEPLKNARAHSDSPEPFKINFGYCASKEGIIFSCHDGGTYFKNPEVKRTWENKTNKDKHISQIYGIGGGMGQNILFDCANLIHIDTNTATLYTGLKTSNEVFFYR